jgi:C4-dicarboxylate-specific signal transduction histidine kinase
VNADRENRLIRENVELRRLLGQRFSELRTLQAQLVEKKLQLNEISRKREEKVREELTGKLEHDHQLIVQALQAALSEFIGHLAHQWRQPLSAISLLIQDLGETCAHGEATKEYLGGTVTTAVEVIQHLSRSINAFRDLFRQDENRQAFNISEVLDRSLSFITSGLRCCDIAVEKEVDANLTVNGYPNEFSRAFLIIMGETTDLLHQRNKANPIIRISAYPEGGKAVVTITDNSGGIPADVINRIFNPNHAAWNTASDTGLGYYLSKIIIEKNMGGRLMASNAAGGAQFRIEM